MQFNTVIDSLPWGIVIIDAHHRIISVNAKAFALLGRRHDDLVGHDCSGLFCQASCQKECPLLVKNCWPEFGTDSGMVWQKTDNGQPQQIEDRLLPWRDKDQTIIGCIHILTAKTVAQARRDQRGTPNLSEYGLLGNSSLIHEVSYLIRSVAPTTSTVPIGTSAPRV